MPDDAGSITRWYEALKTGDRQAAGPLFNRYFGRMIRLARAALCSGARDLAAADEEDAALSAFESFCTGAENDRFPQVDGRDDLWRLLAIITVRTARAQARRQRRLKRGAGLVRRETDLAGSRAGSAGILDSALAREPEPEFTAAAQEELRRLLDLLGDDTLRQLAIWRMEGYTCDEIAQKFGCTRRTVARQVGLIRKLWCTAGDGPEPP
jgi:DNA-directed RNA polymerase specialized sigma24 family protein